MRVLLGAGWYFPDPVGGTEVYVRGLARRLREADVAVTVAAPRDGGSVERYVHDGVPVWRYPVTTTPTPGEVAEAEPPWGFGAWAEILRATRPDVVDFHSLTRGLGLPHLRVAREASPAVVVTVHLARLLCQRGTMMRFGRRPCDGDLERQPCTACRLQARGLPRPMAAVASRTPTRLVEPMSFLPIPRALTRLLRAPEAHVRHRARLREVLALADRVLAPSRWLAEALLRNGLEPGKLAVCAQGIERPSTAARVPRGSALRVGFVGRLDPAKGLPVLLDAVRRLPADLPVECHVWASGESPQALAYRRRIEQLAAPDPRVHAHGPVDDVSSALARLDVLVVPSLTLETGPLVVLEAFAAGVPVVGSDLGGIAERVRHGVDGLLVTPGSADALTSALGELARDRGRVEALRMGIGPVRTMDDVASDTLALYADLVGPTRRPVLGLEAGSRR